MAENKLPIFFRYRIWWHILFWVVVFLMYWLTYGGYLERYREEFIIGLALLPSRIIGTYILIYLILPIATQKKKFVKFGILVFIHGILYGFIIWISYYYLISVVKFYDLSKYSIFYLPKILNNIISNYGIPLFATAIIIFKKWYLDELDNKKLAEEKTAAELSFLKSQIHPHFLFNTLNNLYALTLIKSDKTPDIVLKLSDLLDYMIYNSNDNFVSLKKELEIIQSYIELEKMRYNERLDLKCEIHGEVDGYQIAPLILLPFIENSFKHGASNDRSHPVIRIEFSIDKEGMTLKVVNSIPVDKIKDDSVAEGIGLKNVKRRLELIYPGQYDLLITEEEKQYKVLLKIKWEKK